MTITNDQVRRVTLQDGSPAPEPFEQPLHIDIVMWIPILYISWSIGTLALISIVLFMMNNEEEEYIDYFRGWSIFLFSLVLVQFILSCATTGLICKAALRRGRRNN